MWKRKISFDRRVATCVATRALGSVPCTKPGQNNSMTIQNYANDSLFSSIRQIHQFFSCVSLFIVRMPKGWFLFLSLTVSVARSVNRKCDCSACTSKVNQTKRKFKFLETEKKTKKNPLESFHNVWLLRWRNAEWTKKKQNVETDSNNCRQLDSH